jgi:hypothetical protein
MSLRTTSIREEQITAIDERWRENRPKAPDRFLDEIADTFAFIESVPSLGRPWTATAVPGVRRVVMRATRYHVYYREDE